MELGTYYANNVNKLVRLYGNNSPTSIVFFLFLLLNERRFFAYWRAILYKMVSPLYFDVLVCYGFLRPKKRR